MSESAITQQDFNQRLINSMDDLTEKVNEGFRRTKEDNYSVIIKITSLDARLSHIEDSKKEKKELSLSKEARIVSYILIAVALANLYFKIFPN